jgi:hypothetical protein
MSISESDIISGIIIYYVYRPNVKAYFGKAAARTNATPAAQLVRTLCCSEFALCPPKTAKIPQLKLKTGLQFTSRIMIPIFSISDACKHPKTPKL